jgi:hypothetical protein
MADYFATTVGFGENWLPWPSYRCWPVGDPCPADLSVRNRGIAAVSSAKLTRSKGAVSDVVDTFPAEASPDASASGHIRVSQNEATATLPAGAPTLRVLDFPAG